MSSNNDEMNDEIEFGFYRGLEWTSDRYQDTTDDIAENISALMTYCDDFFKMMQTKINKMNKTLERNQNNLEAVKILLENKQNNIKEKEVSDEEDEYTYTVLKRLGFKDVKGHGVHFYDGSVSDSMIVFEAVFGEHTVVGDLETLTLLATYLRK